MNLTRQPKRKKTTPKVMDLPGKSSMLQWLRSLSRATLKRKRAFRLCITPTKLVNPRHCGQLFKTSTVDKTLRNLVSPRHCGQLFKTSTVDMVKNGKKGQLFHFT